MKYFDFTTLKLYIISLVIFYGYNFKASSLINRLIESLLPLKEFKTVFKYY